MLDPTQTTMRVDKWLWVARFYKTRAQAAEAVNGGHVHINHVRVKPSKLVKQGDEISITKGNQVFTITVQGFMSRRGPALAAQQLYQEHEESIRDRLQRSAQMKLMSDNLGRPIKKPDKRERRRIIRFINKHQQDV